MVDIINTAEQIQKSLNTHGVNLSFKEVLKMRPIPQLDNTSKDITMAVQKEGRAILVRLSFDEKLGFTVISVNFKTLKK